MVETNFYFIQIRIYMNTRSLRVEQSVEKHKMWSRENFSVHNLNVVSNLQILKLQNSLQDSIAETFAILQKYELARIHAI